MILIIHSRKRRGESVFRVYSTASKSYITEEMDRREVTRYVLLEEMGRATRAGVPHHPLDFSILSLEVENAIAIARRKGTSSRTEEAQNLHGDWIGES